jgi:chemotaxis protein CheY-P-specific phosphatase CheC
MDQKKLLHEAFVEVLEGFAFVFLERMEGEVDVPSDAQYICSTIVVVNKKDRFKLVIVAPEALCCEMAANITGSEEEDVAPDMADDALKELANITAGSWAVGCFGETEVCVLESPVATRLSADEAKDMFTQNRECVFQVEDQLVMADIFPKQES